MLSFAIKSALVAAIAQLVASHPAGHGHLVRRQNALAVELSDAGSAGVGMKITNTGDEDLNLLTYATLLDDAPVNKLRVVQDGAIDRKSSQKPS